ncbi:hypothetical protein BZA05DRAFT_391366 [Tricharina praecox]|uniref:uncharacterized protein n=1 Tax=Tricharina praecox TaxID=43433 RepID=UPI00221E69B8|nr:uncharacterized protein BZA05DRAFT_391366 [Tricharina praecox]KAI5855360.1 hypothetical protein BZA05DRAFT_391366 [Tricharina praecox]
MIIVATLQSTIEYRLQLFTIPYLTPLLFSSLLFSLHTSSIRLQAPSPFTLHLTHRQSGGGAWSRRHINFYQGSSQQQEQGATVIGKLHKRSDAAPIRPARLRSHLEETDPSLPASSLRSKVLSHVSSFRLSEAVVAGVCVWEGEGRDHPTPGMLGAEGEGPIAREWEVTTLGETREEEEGTALYMYLHTEDMICMFDRRRKPRCRPREKVKDQRMARRGEERR